MNFNQAFDLLMGREGGYSNNPADPGGETMFGVTFRVARAWGYAGPMKDLPRDTAALIYKAQYWDAVKAEQLPDEVRFDVFDAAANSGPVQAVKWLQRASGVKDDGLIGPATLQALKDKACNLAARFNGIRLMAMTDMGGWPSFNRGWAKRIAGNLQRLS